MMFRKVIFWGHLVAGLTAGVFIMVMAVTGVLLTYEGQIEDWAKVQAVDAPEGAVVLSAEDLLAANGAVAGQVLTLPREDGGLVTLAQGRSAQVLDPYSGAAVEGAGDGVSDFFHAVMSLHRWLSFSGSTEVGGWLIDASNLVFLVLVVSGIYMWLPKAWKWSMLKTRLLSRRGLPTTQARDHNWHHVLGFWALVPLFVIVLTGVIMSYSWANTLLFASVGEDVPVRGGPPVSAPANGLNATGGQQALQRSETNIPNRLERQDLGGKPLAYAVLIEKAQEVKPDWTRASIAVPEDSAGVVLVTLDSGNGQQPGAKTRFVMDRASGEVVSAESGATGTTGAKMRMWARFAHTGQYYGLIGQTIAGLASLAAAVLVWTGIALGYRRLARMARTRRAVA
ncbi:PepSY-associated TM helix domain-containing protein [Sagittula sp. S175]|uniref:PepSY-associated TM helix domain-containing protein n=1 Tax=Sagittula sp. S175 TaxID=3415129 RepID=UPI003C7CF148